MSAVKVASAAEKWVGEPFKAGAIEQCMMFVRHVLGEVGHPLAAATTKKAVDGHWPGLGFANSLAGRDLGAPLVDKIEGLLPGSIVFWDDTYGNWPAGTITHVGIYIGNGQFVHRPTSSRPVEREELVGSWRRLFRCGLVISDPVKSLPPQPPPLEDQRWKLFSHSGRQRILHNGVEQPSGEIKIIAHSGKIGVFLAGKAIEPKYVTVEIVY